MTELTPTVLSSLLSQGESYEQVARRFGVNRQTVSNYAKRWGMRSAHPPHNPGTLFDVFHGERLNLNQIARRLDIPYKVIWDRYRRGDRGDDLTRPPRKKRPTPDCYDLDISLSDWREYAQLAREVGLKTAANRTGLPYGALSAAVRGEWSRLG